MTLIELFISLAILALVSSLVIIKARPMVLHYQFREEISRLAEELEWSRKVAMSSGGEIDFIIEQKGGGLHCLRQTDEPFAFKGGMQRFTLDHISRFTFNQEKGKRLHLVFTRSGFPLEEGELVFFDAKGKAAYAIELLPKERPCITAKKI